MLELLYDTQWTNYTESGGLTTTFVTFNFFIRIMRAVGVCCWNAKHAIEKHASRRVRRGSSWVLGTLYGTQWTTHAESGGLTTTSATL